MANAGSPTIISKRGSRAAGHVDRHREARRQRAARVGASRSSSLWWRIAAAGSSLGRPRGVLVVWPRWESVVRRVRHLTHIPGSSRRLFIMRFTCYHGDSFVLPDGAGIDHGARVGEIHCDNRTLVRLALQHDNPYAVARDELRRLAAWLEEVDPDGAVAGFYGVTILTRAAQRLGFSIRELPHGVSARINRWFMTGLLLLYSKAGTARLGRGLTLQSWPCEVWFSRRELRGRYGRTAGEGAGEWREHSRGNRRVSPEAPAEAAAPPH